MLTKYLPIVKQLQTIFFRRWNSKFSAVCRLGDFCQKRRKACKYLLLFRSILWQENYCKFLSHLKKMHKNKALLLGKCWFCDDKTFSTDCTTIFCACQYDFCCRKTSQYFKHFHSTSVVWKNRVFQKFSKYLHFLLFLKNSLSRLTSPFLLPIII